LNFFDSHVLATSGLNDPRIQGRQAAMLKWEQGISNIEEGAKNEHEHHVEIHVTVPTS